MNSETSSILFYDGVCGFCNKTVNFIMAKEKSKKIMFCSLQSDFAKDFFRERDLTINMDTLFYLKNNQLYSKSKAVFQISKELSLLYRLIGLIRFVVPPFIGDFFYDLVAKNRYIISTKNESCTLPSLEQRKRFIS